MGLFITGVALFSAMTFAIHTGAGAGAGADFLNQVVEQNVSHFMDTSGVSDALGSAGDFDVR